MEQKMELKELTREVCEIAKRAADFTQGNSVVATNGVIQQDLLDAIKP